MMVIGGVYVMKAKRLRGIILIGIFQLFAFSIAIAQWSRFGLDADTVRDIEIFDNIMTAATNNGVFAYHFDNPSQGWQSILHNNCRSPLMISEHHLCRAGYLADSVFLCADIERRQ
jgi:hypothetical protein